MRRDFSELTVPSSGLEITCRRIGLLLPECSCAGGEEGKLDIYGHNTPQHRTLIVQMMQLDITCNYLSITCNVQQIDECVTHNYVCVCMYAHTHTHKKLLVRHKSFG